MRIGFGLPVAGAWATPDNQRRVAQRAEELGFASLWTFQRLLWALDPANPYPPHGGRFWPEPFRRVVDSIVSLSYVAAVTERIRLGTALLNAVYYAPVMLANMLSTLDHVAKGRLVVGLGLGWSKDEYAAVGVPYEDRGDRMDEYLECLHAIWSGPIAEFHGRFYEVPRSIVQPRPWQRPHPPILYGGYSPPSIRRTARYADGWIGGNVPLDEVTPLIGQLREEAEKVGRDPDGFEVVARGSVRLFDEPQGEDRRPLYGTLDEIREDIERYRDAGLTELFLDLNTDPRYASPDSDPGAAVEMALFLMEEFAPSKG